MDTPLDPIEIYARGLRNLELLEGPERLVFLLQEFDILMDMEGWYHFFLYEHHFKLYSEMKDWLSTIDDRQSLVVLGDFEARLKSRGVPLESAEIETFFDSQDDYFRACPDWCEQYTACRAGRWQKAIAYLETAGLRLL